MKLEWNSQNDIEQILQVSPDHKVRCLATMLYVLCNQEQCIVTLSQNRLLPLLSVNELPLSLGSE